jgi:hypothetical protein
LALKNDVQLRILPKHYRCERPLLFDPPIVLHHVNPVGPAVIAAKTKATTDISKPTMLAVPGATMLAILLAATEVPGLGKDGNTSEEGDPRAPHRIYGQEGSQADDHEITVSVYGQKRA